VQSYADAQLQAAVEGLRSLSRSLAVPPEETRQAGDSLLATVRTICVHAGRVCAELEQAKETVRRVHAR
jgi:hypothetical protein